MNPCDSNPPANAANASRPDNLIALEERLTFQQRQIDELFGVVLDHRREIDRLVRGLAQCRHVLDQLRDAAIGENLPHEKPPHY